jgi:hypothetical protein
MRYISGKQCIYNIKGMTIKNVIDSPAFNNAWLSVEIFGAGNVARLANIKNGSRNLTEADKIKIKNYFEKNFQINLEV